MRIRSSSLILVLEAAAVAAFAAACSSSSGASNAPSPGSEAGGGTAGDTDGGPVSKIEGGLAPDAGARVALPCLAGTCPGVTWSTILPDRFDRNSGTVRALDRVGSHTAVVYRLAIDPKPATILAGDGTVAEMISAAGSYVRVYDDHGAVRAGFRARGRH